MAQFEYMTVDVNGSDIGEHTNLSAALNKHGKNGWELVSSITQPHLGSSQFNLFGVSLKNILIFKKRTDYEKEAAK
jgi:hypothetical protein